MAPRTDCPACGERVILAITDGGKRQALDWAPSPAGNTAAQQDVHGTWRARYAPPGEELIFPLKRYMPHAASSPGCFRQRQQDAAEDVRDELAELRQRQHGQREAWGKAAGRHAAAGRNRRGRRGR